jgi:hypothetical protein
VLWRERPSSGNMTLLCSQHTLIILNWNVSMSNKMACQQLFSRNMGANRKICIGVLIIIKAKL